MPVIEPQKLLDAATATGAGTPIRQDSAPGKAIKDYTVEVTVTGSPSAVTVDLEGSLMGVGYAQLAQHVFDAAEITAQFAIFHVASKSIVFIRGNLITLTGGSTPTVTMRFVGAR